MKTLRLILGDQLNLSHSWYSDKDDDIIYLMMEMKQETDYVQHHIQKVVAFLASMRSMAKMLESNGHTVIYYTLDDASNQQSLTLNLDQVIKQYNIEKLEYQLPDEYRLDQQLIIYCKSLDIDHQAYDTEHFLSKRDDLEAFFSGRKTYVMESFYRDMRKKHNILMEGDQPITGQWNYDADNRKKMPKDHVPPPLF